MLRHTFAHNLAVQGESIARLMEHMKADGSPNISMTIRYTKASGDEIGDEMKKLGNHELLSETLLNIFFCKSSII